MQIPFNMMPHWNQMKIPFNKSVLLENHLDSIRVVLESGDTSGNGVFGKKCEAILSKIADLASPLHISSTGKPFIESFSSSCRWQRQ